MMNLVDIGKRIQTLRKRARLNQATVAAYLSVDQSMIAKMEKGERNISSDVIEKLSALFCCPVDYILFGEKASTQCEVAFRAKAIHSEDLHSLARLNKIVLNQFELDKMGEDS